MNTLRQVLRKRRIVLPVRLHFALSTLLTLCASCLLSGLILYVFGQFTDIGQEPLLTHIVCSLLTLVVAGIALAWVAGCYLRPAKIVADAAGQVAAGDFSVRIPQPKSRIGIAEANTLIMDFNRMAQELEGMERMQKDFMGKVSHEFKTPLSSIIGFVEILMEDGLDAKERQEYLGLVHKEAHRLSRLSENLLRLSRLDAQCISTRHTRLAVDEQIRRCVILLAEKFSDKKISLDIRLATMSIESDADLLEQIWLNLIDNALKYSPPEKTLHISGFMTASSIVVSIRDEGLGIPPTKQKYIWNRFYQCEESHKEHGHGLGLAIVRCAVDVLGGAIECRSAVGYGTEMLVTIPLHIAKNPSLTSH
ncbi:MAG: HAMP domain-containing histidine kinase [Desulfovibrionaceae bacterium]|nr:HAMP domain-containing histidine kinase [Desulfovibrionaceae bacterium]